MSQHPSLSSADKDKQHRSVLKRYEKIKILKEKEKWQDGDSVYRLPKVKVMKFKIKKEKAAPAEGAEAEGAQAAATPGAESPLKGAAVQAKPQGASKDAAKPQGKTQEGKKEAK